MASGVVRMQVFSTLWAESAVGPVLEHMADREGRLRELKGVPPNRLLPSGLRNLEGYQIPWNAGKCDNDVDHRRWLADVRPGDSFAREYGANVRQSISLSNLAGLGNAGGQMHTDSSALVHSTASALAVDPAFDTTAVTPCAGASTSWRCPSAPVRRVSMEDSDRGPYSANRQASVRSHAILSNAFGCEMTESQSICTSSPMLSAPAAPAAPTACTIRDALTGVAQSATPPMTQSIWSWLGSQPATNTEAASAPLPPCSPHPLPIPGPSSDMALQPSTPRSHGPFITAVPQIPIAHFTSPPPGWHEQFWPQTLSASSTSNPGSQATSPRSLRRRGRGLSLQRQSSCPPRSQPIDLHDPSMQPVQSTPGLIPEGSGLTCRTHSVPLARPQSAPSGSPHAMLSPSPSTGLWSAMPWASLSQAVRGVTSIESASLVSDSNACPLAAHPGSSRSLSARQPLESFPLLLDDLKDEDIVLDAAEPSRLEGPGSLAGTAEPQPTIIGSLVAAMFGQEVPQAPADAVVPSGRVSSTGAVSMPGGVREGFGSTSEVVDAIPDRMMVELAAMFDEPWATECMGGSKAVAIGVGGGSMLGHATHASACGIVERVWSHDDPALNVSFVLDRHPLRDGLFAYRSRLRMYGSCADNACTFMLRDDVIRSGNPSILMYDRLESSGCAESTSDEASSVVGAFPESGILHSCIKMPGFLKTRQYVACRRVWRWRDRPQCLIVSIPFEHPDAEELCKGKGTIAQDYRMGYVVRCVLNAAQQH